MATFRVYRAERAAKDKAERENAELKEGLRPKIKLSFLDTDTGCVRPNTIIQTLLANRTVAQVSCTYYRVKVDATSHAAVANCSGRMTEIWRNGRVFASGENIALTFAPAEEADTRAKTVYPKAPEHLDFLAITKDNHVIMPTYKWTGPSSIAWDKLFTEIGNYKFHIVVTSPQSHPVEIDMNLEWTGDHNTAKILST